MIADADWASNAFVSELANQTLDENKLRVDIGTLAPIDVVQTQADVQVNKFGPATVSGYTVHSRGIGCVP